MKWTAFPKDVVQMIGSLMGEVNPILQAENAAG